LIVSRVTRGFGKNCPIFWKVAKTVAKQNNAKLETIFQMAYLGESVINL
jgi:hypothetical protein